MNQQHRLEIELRQKKCDLKTAKRKGDSDKALELSLEIQELLEQLYTKYIDDFLKDRGITITGDDILGMTNKVYPAKYFAFAFARETYILNARYVDILHTAHVNLKNTVHTSGIEHIDLSVIYYFVEPNGNETERDEIHLNYDRKYPYIRNVKMRDISSDMQYVYKMYRKYIEAMAEGLCLELDIIKRG